MARSDSGSVHVVLCTDGVFPFAMGGMQRHSRLLAEHLSQEPGIRLTVVHPHTERVFEDNRVIEEVRIDPIDPNRVYLIELWRYSARMRRTLERLVPDVVLSQGFCVWRGMARFHDRLVVMPHGLEMFQGLGRRERLMGAPFRLALRHIVRQARFVVSLGGRLTPILHRLAKESACAVVTIPNAVQLPATVSPYPTASRPVRLLFVGRFAFNKGLDLLIDVAQRLVSEGRGDDVLFQLAGDGPLLKEIRAQEVPRNIELLGRVDDDILAQAYARCHGFVLPTRFEGMPTVVLEAMAHARPVIVSDVGATAELVDSENGFLVPPGDAEMLHRTVLRFLALSQADRERMGIAGRSRVEARFTWDAVTKRFLELIHGIHPPT
ncbi:MAG: glycosyltransferase family 4 protein [Flavobacteriales bacterium]|nr:glycosyltransferase family 4 protein [Flavobacteriales bacterium]